MALCASRNLSDALAFPSERRDLDGSPGNLTVLCTSACIPSRCSHQGVKTKIFDTLVANLKTFSWLLCQVALRSGWLEQGKLPSMVMSQKDLDELAKRP